MRAILQPELLHSRKVVRVMLAEGNVLSIAGLMYPVQVRVGVGDLVYAV